MLNKFLAALLGSLLLAGAAMSPVAFAGDKADESKQEAPKEESK